MVWGGLHEALSSVYSKILSTKGDLDDVIWMMLVLTVLHEVTLNVINSAYWLASKVPAWRVYKLQPDQDPPRSQIMWAAVHVYANRIFVQMPVGYGMLRVWYHLGGRAAAPVPSLGGCLLQLSICVLFMEVWFYFAHRAMHWGPLYRRFHKRHHEFTSPVGIASEYAHPVEDVVVNMCSVFGGPVLGAVHPLVFIVYIFLRLWETLDAHSGYALPWSPFVALPYPGGPELHDFHHQHHTKGCWGVLFMDTLMGTDKEFYAWKAKRKAAAAAASTNGTSNGISNGQQNGKKAQ